MQTTPKGLTPWTEGTPPPDISKMRGCRVRGGEFTNRSGHKSTFIYGNDAKAKTVITNEQIHDFDNTLLYCSTVQTDLAKRLSNETLGFCITKKELDNMYSHCSLSNYIFIRKRALLLHLLF